MNLLFDGFTYNTRRHFANCSYVTPQLAKYPRVLYHVKPPNKTYIFPRRRDVHGEFTIASEQC